MIYRRLNVNLTQYCSIVEKENFDAVDLVYHSNNGKDIRIEDIASGFKPLVYMLRLIENGWLTENTLLEIDEPETNLHPQWVVELAHLLVRINKTFGTKILITSHNPDMVSAIRYISEKEGLLNTTRFYLAEQSESTDSFYYKNLGCDIEPVFESFNKSFDTLQKYVENYGKFKIGNYQGIKIDCWTAKDLFLKNIMLIRKLLQICYCM